MTQTMANRSTLRLLAFISLQRCDNPTSNGNFRLQYTSAEKKARFVYVYDAQGRTVQSVNVGEYPQTFEIEMSLPSQANGIYFVQIAGDGEILAKEKIMLTR